MLVYKDKLIWPWPDAPEQIQSVKGYFERYFKLDSEDCRFWIAGGCLRDYFSLGYHASDIDVFFPSREDFDKFSSISKFEGAGKIIFENENTKRLLFTLNGKDVIVDLIKKFFSSPEETISEFDFTICCVAMDRLFFYCNSTFFIDLAKKRLVVNKLPYPLSTLQRLQKYIIKGFRICNGGLLEIAKAISEIDLSNPDSNHLAFYPDGSPKFRRID
jgi:hypothetical protein